MPVTVDSLKSGLCNIVAALLLFAGCIYSSQSAALTMSYADVGNGSTVLYVVGTFAYGDDQLFERSISSPVHLFVSFHSPGGNLDAAIKIGRTIHRLGLLTYVGPGSQCSSACALAWLGGRERVLSSNAHIGVHAASYGDEVSSDGNARVGLYLAQVGLGSDDVVFYLTHTAPQDIELLTFDKARSLGIPVELKEWSQSAVRQTNYPQHFEVVPSAPPTAPAPSYDTHFKLTPPSPGYAPPAPQPPMVQNDPGWVIYDRDPDTYNGPVYSPPPPPPVIYAPSPIYRQPVCCMPRFVPARPIYRRR